jgi:hypothetical protein
VTDRKILESSYGPQQRAVALLLLCPAEVRRTEWVGLREACVSHTELVVVGGDVKLYNACVLDLCHSAWQALWLRE